MDNKQTQNTSEVSQAQKDDQKWAKGPDKLIETLKDVVRYLKILRDSLASKMPYTSGRIQESILAIKKAQQKK